jgi:NADPH:quinone reductase-like Zn-dependent oxidoreductase
MKVFSLLTVTAAAAIIAPVHSLATPPLRVTVFGGTGYVGSAVCERLIKRGHKVTAVSRRGKNPKPDSTELSQVCFELNMYRVFK